MCGVEDERRAVVHVGSVGSFEPASRRETHERFVPDPGHEALGVVAEALVVVAGHACMAR